jgi:hypothetical protein
MGIYRLASGFTAKKFRATQTNSGNGKVLIAVCSRGHIARTIGPINILYR